MRKYINADKLITGIEQLKETNKVLSTRQLSEYLQGSIYGFDLAVEKILSIISSFQQEQPEPYFYCKYGGTIPLCSDCKRNHNNSPFKTEEITTWYAPSNGTKHCIDYIQQEQPHKSFCKENCKGYRDTGGKCFFGFNCSAKKAQEQPEALEVSKFCQPVPENIANCVSEHYWEMLDDEEKEDTRTIETAQQEQPEVDLEEEVKKYFEGYWPGMKTPEACNHQMVFTTPAIMRMIEHFYELGLNARKEG